MSNRLLKHWEHTYFEYAEMNGNNQAESMYAMNPVAGLGFPGHALSVCHADDSQLKITAFPPFLLVYSLQSLPSQKR